MAIAKEEIELTSEQETVVKAFLKKYPKADRFTAVKFCYGRKFEIQRVFPLYEAYLQVVQERGLAGLSAADVLSELKTEKMYIPGSRDKKGAALFVVQASRHIPGQFPHESTIKLAYYLGDIITANLKTQRNGITLLIDLKDTEWSSFDVAFMSDLIGFFQNHIPAAVKNILIWRAPWWIRSAIKIVSPFLKEKMRRRIKLCDNLYALKGFVDEDQLPEDFGGTFTYDHQSFIRRQISQRSGDGVLASLTETTAALEDAAAVAAGDFEGAAETIPLAPGSKLMVAAEDERLLQAERCDALQELNGRLAQVKKNPPEQTQFPVPLYAFLHNRACRMTMDVTAYYRPVDEDELLWPSRRTSLTEELWLAVRDEPDEAAQIMRMKEAILQK